MDNKLKYIDYINAFNNWCYDHKLDGKTQLLFFKILHLINNNRWEEWTEMSNFRLIDICDFSNVPSFTRSRDKLIELGFIEYQKGKKRQPNKYRLVKEFFVTQKEKYSVKFDTTNVTTNVTESVTESVTKSDTISVTHNKMEDIDIDISPLSTNVDIPPKGNNTSKTNNAPTKSDVDCKNSNNQKTHAAKNDIHNLIDNYTENKELRLELKEYLEMRKAKKVPNTRRAIQLNLNKLSKLADNDEGKIAIVQKTIEHGWVSFFPNSEGKSGVNRERNPSYDIDEQRRYCQDTLMRSRSTDGFSEALKEELSRPEHIEVEVT